VATVQVTEWIKDGPKKLERLEMSLVLYMSNIFLLFVKNVYIYA
jgi:hypothetical protein